MTDEEKRRLILTAALLFGAAGLLVGGHVGIAVFGTAIAGTWILGGTGLLVGGLAGALVAELA